MPGPVAVQLEAALLRSTLPELVLREGMVMAARVLSHSGGHGVLSLAGRQIRAQLPPDLKPGEEVRLRVEQLGDDRIVLRVVDQSRPPAAAQTPVVALPLPGGETARVSIRTEQEREPSRAEGEQAPSVVVSYESPRLGPLEFVLTLQPATLRAVIRAPTGALVPLGEGADALCEALATATNRPAEVSILERREPLDLYA